MPSKKKEPDSKKEKKRKSGGMGTAGVLRLALAAAVAIIAVVAALASGALNGAVKGAVNGAVNGVQNLNSPPGGAKAIPRYAARDLPGTMFKDRFLGKMPVVVETPQEHSNMTIPELVYLCDHLTIDVMHDGGKGWANLFYVGTWTIAQLAQAWDYGSSHLYGFEGDTTCGCPALLERLGVRVPPYFAEDVLWEHMISRWPSLLIGPASTGSGMHIDRDGLPFWIQVATGRKRMRVIVWDDVKAHLSHLWNDFGVAKDAGVLQRLDFFDERMTQELIGKGVTIWEETLGPGDLLYIPQLAAHAAQNFGETVVMAISGNFMDGPHALILKKQWEELGCFREQPAPGCNEDQANLLRIVAREGVSQKKVARGEWLKFPDWYAAQSRVPWCFAKVAHCKISEEPISRILEECEAEVSDEDVTTVALAKSEHLRSAGLSNHVGAQLLREANTDGLHLMEVAEPVFQIGAAQGHTMATRNLGNVRLAISKWREEPGATIQWRLPKVKAGYSALRNS